MNVRISNARATGIQYGVHLGLHVQQLRVGLALDAQDLFPKVFSPNRRRGPYPG